MSKYIKCFNEGGEISFKTEDDNIFLKYNEIWKKSKKDTIHKVS